MTNPDNVTTEVRDQVFLIRLNRPQKRNALTLEMMDSIASAALESDRHSELRAIVLCGAGPIFSSGIDLMALVQARAEAGDQHPARFGRRLAERLQGCLNTLESTELPVIAALHGQVLGMAAELALACDLRVAAESCQLRFPEVSLGLVADVGGTTRLSKTVGPSRAKDLLMTGRSIDAQEALAWGLVNRVVPEERLRQAVFELAGQIGANAPLPVGMFKRIIDQGDGLDRASQMALERWAQSQLLTSEDLAEAMAAYMEKRKPKFKGR